MNTLSIDCSSSIMSVSLESGERLFELSIQDGFKNSEYLMPVIDSLFKTSEITNGDLDLIAVASGPGSFTGLRIAMSTAKGIAYGSNAHIISVPTLDAYGHGMDYFDGVVVPVIDARKKRFYSAVFKQGLRIVDDMDISSEDLLNSLKKENKILITGPDCNLFTSLAENSRIYIDKRFTSTASTAVLHLGKVKYDKKGPDAHGSGPVYIRKSEAEISLFGE